MKHKKSIKPPRLTQRVLRLFFALEKKQDVLDDFDEIFLAMVEDRGEARAKRWYRFQVIKIIQGKMYNKLYWSIPMFGSYIKIAIRTIRKQKVYSAINIAGLAIGIACCILVMLYVRDELSYDQFHEKKDFIYRVTSRKFIRENSYFSPRAPWPVGKLLKDRFPEIKSFTRMGLPYGSRVQVGDNIFISNYEARVDPAFLKIFTFPLIKGDSEKALDDPLSIVVTESFARKCFGHTDVMDETIKIRSKDRQVTGVVRDVPYNSHMTFDFLVPGEWPDKEGEYDWKVFASTYVQTNHPINLADFNKKIKHLAKEYDAGVLTQISLQPLDKVYLHSNFLQEEHDARESWDIKIGSINNLYVLSLAAFCILLIACMNFMNLATAMAGCRAREIGVRKVMGSQKKDIVKQFLGESVVIAFLSLIFALMLVYQFLPAFNRLSDKQLSIQGLFNIDILPGIIAVTLFTGLISGSYPALFLSSLKSVDVFKRAVFLDRKNRLPLRKVLIVLQFSIAIVVIICTTVFYRQVHYMQGRYSAFDSDNIIVALDWTFADHREAVKNKFLQHPNILGVSHSEGPGNYFNPTSDVDWPGKNPDEERIFYTFTTDPDFAKVFNSEILAGRFFSNDKPADESNYVLNETAVKLMGIESPVGKRFSFNGKTGMIIGVVKDRSFGPPQYRVQPLVFLIDYKHPRFNIKVDNTENIPVVLDYINKMRKEFAYYKPVSHRFVKDDLEKYYRKEQNLSRIFAYITFLTIFLACLGLLGLSAFHAERRTKEIGIRKVFGSSVPGIVVLLIREFVKWILLANIIAWGVAYFISNRWLRDYVYRINTGFDIFIFSAVLVFAVAILTVGFQAVKSARTNPVDALRYE